MSEPLPADRTVGTAVSLRCQTGRHELCHGEAVNNRYERGPCQCECHHAPRQVDPDTLRDATLGHIDLAQSLLRQAADQIQFARQDTPRHQASLSMIAAIVADQVDELEQIAGELDD